MSGNTGSTCSAPSRDHSRRIVLAALLFIVVAIALKYTTFGDTNRSVDESFYLLVGQRMHEGLLPYVDVWDRKPLGIFIIYYWMAALPSSVLAFQIVACLFAAATALVIARIVERWAGWQGGALAGLAYLITAVICEGVSGQTPDFYNLLVATAALLIIREADAIAQGVVRWRIWAAMALCAVAITIKQTAAFESLFFGCYVLAALHRAGVPPLRIARTGIACGLIGAFPTVVIAAYYWSAGHWPEFWHAMVTSNFAKGAIGGKAFLLTGIALRLALLLPFAVWGLATAAPSSRVRAFLGGWLLAAIAGFLAIPNFSLHYALPLLVPLSVAAGLLLEKHRYRRVLAAAFALYASLWYHPPSQAQSRASTAAMDAAARSIRKLDRGGGLLVFDGPPYLYSLSAEAFLSPLVFPHHLSSDLEKDVSHLPTGSEIDRILAHRPGVIVMAHKPYIFPINEYARARVVDYAQRNCRAAETITLIDAEAPVRFNILGDCGLPVAAR